MSSTKGLVADTRSRKDVPTHVVATWRVSFSAECRNHKY